eukprot:scaffold28319_cov65-Cyclotella_meneghiniana.AAC.2
MNDETSAPLDNTNDDLSDLELDDDLWPDVEENAKKQKRSTVVEQSKISKTPPLTFPNPINRANQERSLGMAGQPIIPPAHSLSIRKATLDCVIDVNSLSESEKISLSKAWSDVLLASRGMLPLDEYNGENENQKRLNRIIDHYQKGMKGINGNSGFPLNEIFTSGGMMLIYGLFCFKVVGDKVQCNECTMKLTVSQSSHLARHAAYCNPDNASDVCKWCGLDDSSKDARLKASHGSNCKQRFETLQGNLDDLMIIHTLDPMCREAMLNGHKTKWVIGPFNRDLKISKLKAMNNAQNCPLGPSNSDEAIDKMKRVAKCNRRKIIKDSISQPLGYRKREGVARADGGLFRELLVDLSNECQCG